MPIKIKSTSGSVTLSAENTAGDNTLTIPNLSGSNSVISTGDTATVTETMVHAAAVNAFKSGRKNLIINGDMRIAQRGAAGYSTTNNLEYMSVDRWAGWGSGGTYQISQEVTSTSDLESVGGCMNYMRYNITVGDDGNGARQMIEDVRSIPSNAKITVSFYVRGTVGEEVESEIQVNYGSGGSTQETIPNSEILFTLTSSWVRHSFTVDYTDLAGKTVGSSSAIRMKFTQLDTDTAPWYFDLTGVQMELGTTATDFEHRSYGEELALCQRYYQETGPGCEFAGFANGSSMAVYTVPLSVPLRSVPTILSLYSSITAVKHNGYVGSSTTPIADSSSASSGPFNPGHSLCISMYQTGFSGLSDMHGINLYTGNAQIAMDSEL